MKKIDTLIELYDPRTHLYNALGVMMYRPRRVVFLIPEHSVNIYEKYKNEYKAMWKNHSCMPEKIISVLTKTSDIIRLAEAITQFCGEDTILDVEGGTPEFYLAAGYVCGTNPDGIKCVRIDFFDEKLTEYTYNGTLATSDCRSFTDEEKELLSLTVEESIRIYGGEIVRDSFSELIAAGMTKDEIINESRTLWEIVYNVAGRDWNDIVPDKIHSSYDENLIVYTDTDDRKWSAVPRVINELTKASLLKEAYRNGGRIYYTCSSPLVFSCLRKAGEALELYTLGLAYSIEGVKDARCGVSLAFDDGEGSSENEVDCIYVSGSTPVFVSCKNGYISSDELYKFNTVSEQFGGNEKISLLVAPHFRANDRKSQNLVDRADLYKISFVTEFEGKTHEQMTELLRTKTDERKNRIKT